MAIVCTQAQRLFKSRRCGLGEACPSPSLPPSLPPSQSKLWVATSVAAIYTVGQPIVSTGAQRNKLQIPPTTTLDIKDLGQLVVLE